MDKFDNWLRQPCIHKLSLKINFQYWNITTSFFCKTKKNVSVSIGKIHYIDSNKKFLSFEKSFSEALFNLNNTEKIGLNDYELIQTKANLCKLLDKKFLKNEIPIIFYLKSSFVQYYNEAKLDISNVCLFENSQNVTPKKIVKKVKSSKKIKKCNNNNNNNNYNDYEDLNNNKLSENITRALNQPKINNFKKVKNIPTLNYDYDQFVYDKNGNIKSEIFPKKLEPEKEKYEIKLLNWALEHYFNGANFDFLNYYYYNRSQYPDSIF